jgi:hypothetical protein
VFDRELGVFLAILEHENAQRHVVGCPGLLGYMDLAAGGNREFGGAT